LTAVGGDGLHTGIWRFAPVRGPDQRHDRSEADADDRRSRLRGGVGLGGASQTTACSSGPALQGTFGALLAPSVLSILTPPSPTRGNAGGHSGSTPRSPSPGGVRAHPGGFLTQYLDWRWCLYVNLPISALVAVSAFRMIPKRFGNPESGSTSRTILGCGGLVALVYGSAKLPPMDGARSASMVRWWLPWCFWRCSCWCRQRHRAPSCPCAFWPTATGPAHSSPLFWPCSAMFGTFLFSLTCSRTSITTLRSRPGCCSFRSWHQRIGATQLASRLMPHLAPGCWWFRDSSSPLSGWPLDRVTPTPPTSATSCRPSSCSGSGSASPWCPASALPPTTPNPLMWESLRPHNTSQQIGASVGTALLNTIAATATAAYLPPIFGILASWPRRRYTDLQWRVGGRPVHWCWPRWLPASSSMPPRSGAGEG